MKKTILISAILFLLLAVDASATTWAPTKKTCPVCKTENTFQAVMSYGTYIYRWPSKFQMIFWPMIDGNVLYSCKKCRLTCFMWDFNKIPEDKIPAISKLNLASLPGKWNKTYADIPMSIRLEWAEKVYGELKSKDDLNFWCLFYRVKGYHLDMAKNAKGADEARSEALALAEKMIQKNDGTQKELLVISAAMKFFLKNPEGALKDLRKAKSIKFNDPKLPAQNNENADRYFSELIDEYIVLAGKVDQKASPDKPAKNAEAAPAQASVTAHLESKIIPGQNLVFCATFQLAWNELKDGIIREDIRLKDGPPVVAYLNKGLSTKSDLHKSDYVALADYAGKGVLDKINTQLRKKFGKDAPVVEENLQPEDILAYAFLMKNLRFKTPFEKIEPPLHFKKQKVLAFGINNFSAKDKNHTKIAKQTPILFYSGPNNFAVCLKAKSSTDEIILAKIEPEDTLLETIGSLEKRISAESFIPKWSKGDRLVIPVIEFDVRHSYSDLLKKFLLNKGFEKHFIEKAVQHIKFNLNEKGAILESDAKILLAKKNGHTPKRMVFDKDFLLYIRKKGAKHPYLALWVADPTVMKRAVE